MKVQFGSGGTKLHGFAYNHDIEVDITKPLPYGDASVSMIVCSHCLEHVECKSALGFLTECHRILQNGAVARITCPIIGQWMPVSLAIDLTINHGHKILVSEQLMRDLFWMAGFDPQKVRRVDWDERYDTHRNVIGKERDDLESCRMEARK